jgi:hypothetical protein
MSAMISTAMALVWALRLVAPAAGATPAKLPDDVSKEMLAAIVAVDKALGLESWGSWGGSKPCVDRGGSAGPAKDITPAQTRSCAEGAVKAGLPQLGKSYVVAILMAPVGPVTVIALGLPPHGDWGAYSCDPGKTCKPVRLDQDNKWSKRMIERRARACVAAETVWLPDGAGKRVCPQGSDKK